MRVLLVEDDAELRLLIAKSLSQRGFFLDSVGNVEDAKFALLTNGYRAAIFDRGLPDGDGMDLVRHIRRLEQSLPVLILTATCGAANRICGLDAGADDYLEKPFDMNELAARLRALARRSQNLDQDELTAGRIRFNVTTRMTYTPNGAVKLSRREAALLEQFMRRVGVTVLREQLEHAVYGFDDAVTPNALEAHISRLRIKLKAANACVEMHAMPGIGYLMSEMHS
jgi:DNA-binding response OmpR family regulator